MKSLVILITLCVFILAAAGQETTPPPAPAVPRPPSPPMGMPGIGMLQPPAALAGEFWKDPEVVADLHLTDAQIKALEQTSLNTKLGAIDSGAGALKSFVQLQALLDADQVDQAAYNNQLTALSAAVDKLIRDFGAMALTVRKTLSSDQWHKLEAMRAERREIRPMQPGRPAGPRRPRQPATPPM